MVEIETVTCGRCGEETDIDMMYFEISTFVHEHAEDPNFGTYEDRNQMLCQTCFTEFQVWFDTDVDSMEEWEEKRSEEIQNLF